VDVSTHVARDERVRDSRQRFARRHLFIVVDPHAHVQSAAIKQVAGERRVAAELNTVEAVSRADIVGLGPHEITTIRKFVDGKRQRRRAVQRNKRAALPIRSEQTPLMGHLGGHLGAEITLAKQCGSGEKCQGDCQARGHG
jgi:hypothetical protein